MDTSPVVVHNRDLPSLELEYNAGGPDPADLLVLCVVLGLCLYLWSM